MQWLWFDHGISVVETILLWVTGRQVGGLKHANAGGSQLVER